MNVVLFGFGRAGKIHYNNCISNTNINLKYVIDVYDISNYLNNTIKYIDYNNKSLLNKILNDTDIQAVIIASPTYLHYETIILCLNYNKHIFVEKPISNDNNNISECFDIAEKKKP